MMPISEHHHRFLSLTCVYARALSGFLFLYLFLFLIGGVGEISFSFFFRFLSFTLKFCVKRCVQFCVKHPETLTLVLR